MVTDLQVVSGQGCRVYDVNDHVYLDFTAGIAASSTGHCHPEGRPGDHRPGATFRPRPGQRLHARPARTGVGSARRVDPRRRSTRSSSATPATRSSRRPSSSPNTRPGASNIITFDGAFHGRTLLTMAMSTSRAIDRAGYGPFPGGVFVAPFPDPHASDQEVEICRALRGLDRLFQAQIPADRGRGDRRSSRSSASAATSRPLRRSCPVSPSAVREHGILFVADETQSGFGRTGKMFAIESHDVEPDIICMAKGIASGFPFAALGTRRVASTICGGPAATAVRPTARRSGALRRLRRWTS